MPASEVRRFGQVWLLAGGTRWMLICRTDIRVYDQWRVLYMGMGDKSPEEFWRAKAQAGDPILGLMSMEIGEWTLLEAPR